MRPLALLLSMALAFHPGRALAQALDEAANMAGSASMGDQRFDGARSGRSSSDGVSAADSPATKKTLAPPTPPYKIAKQPPQPDSATSKKLDLNSSSAKRGGIIGALAAGAIGASSGAILGWAIFAGSFLGIFGLAVVGAVAFGLIGHDAGRHCGADPECG